MYNQNDAHANGGEMDDHFAEVNMSTTKKEYAL